MDRITGSGADPSHAPHTRGGSSWPPLAHAPGTGGDRETCQFLRWRGHPQFLALNP
jgi:hypothetical protein